MPKKKIKEKRIHCLLDKIRYEKLLRCAGEYNTYTEVLNKSIDGYYYSMFKTNDIIDMSISSNREVVKQLQKQEIKHEENQESLEDLKAQFIARRKAKREGDSNA